MDQIKGYDVESGFKGYVNGEYMLFASYRDYREYIEEEPESE